MQRVRAVSHPPHTRVTMYGDFECGRVNSGKFGNDQQHLLFFFWQVFQSCHENEIISLLAKRSCRHHQKCIFSMRFMSFHEDVQAYLGPCRPGRMLARVGENLPLAGEEKKKNAW